MSWIEVRAALPPVDDVSPIVEIFRDFGIDTTREEAGSLIGCLADVDGTSDRIEQLKGALLQAGVTDVGSLPLEEQNWHEVWRQFFHPQRIGRRLVVRPTWDDNYEKHPDDLVIVLDPGEAFGTGDHSTTRLCLALLEGAVKRGDRVADVGCGSGILAIAACRLGAEEVHAVDSDPTSVEVARANAALNNVEFTLETAEGLATLHPPYDVIVSNIISAVLIAMAAQAARAIRPGGEWIVSGILADNWPLVQSAALSEGFTLRELVQEGDWVAAALILN